VLYRRIGSGRRVRVHRAIGAPEVERAYTQAHLLCQDMTDLPTLFPVLCGLWNFYLARVNFRRVTELADQLFALARLAEELGHLFGIGQILWAGTIVCEGCGNAGRGEKYTQALISLCHREGIAVWVAGGTILQGWVLTEQGRPEEGITQIR
jgi:hypothetical protein